MTILAAELQMKKSKVVSDVAANGGLMDNASNVVSGVSNNVWPSVFKAERLAGSTKYRKTFLKVANDNDETLYSAQVWLDIVTPGNDWVTFFEGTQTDIQDDITGEEEQYGCAILKTAPGAGDGSIVVTVEDSSLASGDDAIFRSGGTIRITSKSSPSGSGVEELHTINGAPSVSGNDVTLTLTGTLANPYPLIGTRVMSVYQPGDIEVNYDNLVVITAGDGTYDDTTYPLIMDAIGTINQEITITFTGASSFTVTSNVSGVTLPGGSISADYAPSNPDVSKPYFTIDKDGWTGTWANGDTLIFETMPAAIAIWQKRVIPSACESLVGNRTTVVFSGESI